MSLTKDIKEHKRAQKARAEARFYNLCSILGNTWAIFYGLLGGRMTGKSYSVTEFLCSRKKKLGNRVKNYWLRISETSTEALLTNKADKLVDPDLKRKYDLQLTRKGSDVFNKGETFMTVLPLSGFAKLKGVGFFDKDFEGEYNIVLDEFQLEQGERRTSFDVLYNFIGMIENLVRTTKKNVRVFLIGNTLEEASTILKAFNFIPQKFGRFYLKSKRCVIDNMEPTEEYLKERKGSIADLLGGDSMSNYTNELTKDTRLITKDKLSRITGLIMFQKSSSSWFTIWDDKVITRYTGQKSKRIYAMRPYLGELYDRERRQMVIDKYDVRSWKFKDLITQSYFQDEMMKIRKTN